MDNIILTGALKGIIVMIVAIVIGIAWLRIEEWRRWRK